MELRRFGGDGANLLYPSFERRGLPIVVAEDDDERWRRELQRSMDRADWHSGWALAVSGISIAVVLACLAAAMVWDCLGWVFGW